MKFSLSWLKEHLDTDASCAEIAEKLTAIGLEVEGVIDRAKSLADFKVAEIISAEPHPDADRLKLCQVKTQDGVVQVVCGAPNARAGLPRLISSITIVNWSSCAARASSASWMKGPSTSLRPATPDSSAVRICRGGTPARRRGRRSTRRADSH